MCLFFLFMALFFTMNDAHSFRDLGVPIREAVHWGVHAGPGKTGKTDTIYISFAQYQAPLFLLAVNPDTGEMKQFNGPLPSEMGSWGFTLDRENRIYLGSYYNARLLRFDPRTETWEDLGHFGAEKDTFICSLTTAPDGKIWGGTFPSTHLFSFDPKTGEREDVGPMDPDQFYCYPTAGADGLIYCGIQFERIDLLVFDPKEKTRVSLLPPEDRKPGRIQIVRGRDGNVYAHLTTKESWFRIEGGKRLVPVASSLIPFPGKSLPDGRTFSMVDSSLLILRNPSTRETKEIPLTYEASGSFLFVIGSGPDGMIYGSSMLPLRLFAYNPRKGGHTNLGKAALSTGEVYSLGPLDKRLYLCSYPGGRLSVYDPGKPLRFGDRDDSNPRDMGPLSPRLYRPRAMIAGPLGRIYVGGYPDYGLIGGSFGFYDPGRDEKKIYDDVIPKQSIASMAYLDQTGLLALGSSIQGGTGTHPVEKEARLALWDPRGEKKIFEIVPVPKANTILSLCATRDGILYGITDNEKVFVFHAKGRKVRKVFDLGLKQPREVSLQPGPDNKLYGLAREAVFSIDPETDRITLLGVPPTPIHSGMAIHGRKIFYGSGAHLWEFEIPSESPFPEATQ